MSAPEFDVVWNGSVRAIEPFTRSTMPAAPSWHALGWNLSKVCRGCGETFRIKPSEVDRRHNCSRACLAKPVHKICPRCQAPFTVPFKRRDQVHCSRQCHGDATAERRGRSRMAELGRLGGLKSGAVRREKAAR